VRDEASQPHAWVPSPPCGMATIEFNRNKLELEFGSEPTVWDGDVFGALGVLYDIVVPSPPCGMVIHDATAKWQR